MSAYSGLILAANTGLRGPLPLQARALLDELGLVDPARQEKGLFNLADDLIDLFKDTSARAQNYSFFSPDTIGFGTEIEILGPETDYCGKGLCFEIHGNGYFWPWDADMLRSRVLSHPKLVRLRAVLHERFGGRFRIPFFRGSLRDRLLLDDGGGWAWFGSESY